MHVHSDQQHSRHEFHDVDPSRKLQRKLYMAARGDRNRRFHALYDRIYRPDILWRAWDEVRANGGRGGVDGQTFKEIESNGVEDFLLAIEKELRERRYIYHTLKDELLKVDLVLTPGEFRHWLSDAMN